MAGMSVTSSVVAHQVLYTNASTEEEVANNVIKELSSLIKKTLEDRRSDDVKQIFTPLTETYSFVSYNKKLDDVSGERREVIERINSTAVTTIFVSPTAPEIKILKDLLSMMNAVLGGPEHTLGLIGNVSYNQSIQYLNAKNAPPQSSTVLTSPEEKKN